MKNTNPMDKKEKVQQSNDEHIGQDFNGYPKGLAKENIINPKTKVDKLTAKTVKRSGTKQNPSKNKTAKAGDTTGAEKALANMLNGPYKTGTHAGSNKAERLRKQKK